jgi:hypothetical protein
MSKGMGMNVYKPIVGAFSKAAVEGVFGTGINHYGCSGSSEVTGRIKYHNVISKKYEPGGALGFNHMAKQKTNLLKLVPEQMLAHLLKATSREADCDRLGVWELGHG